MNDLKPILIYDGTCTFCRSWVDRVRRRLNDRIDYKTQDDAQASMNIQQLRGAVRLIESDGRIRSGAEAVFRIWSMTSGMFGRILFWMYQNIPGFSMVCEWGYRRIANNRHRLGKRCGP